jgi:hypothetical protein
VVVAQVESELTLRLPKLETVDPGELRPLQEQLMAVAVAVRHEMKAQV